MAQVAQDLYCGPIDTHLPRGDAIDLCSSDPLFYCHYFFGKAYRQEDPPFARKVWSVLDNPENRYVNIQLPRGWFKTTVLRTLMSKRIAFGQARTILYVGKSDEHGTRSVSWIRKQVLFNDKWRNTFGLGKGAKFAEGTLEISHGVEGEPVYVTAAGITGSIRGINFDDYRPALIILDDIIDRESVHTPAARKKITELVHGDIKESLEVATDNPFAQMVYIGTPLDSEDPGEMAKLDPEWVTFSQSCWTNETKDLGIEDQVSAWPARFPTETLRKKKLAAIQTNKLYIFLAEMECRITSPETSSFDVSWLKYYDILPPLEEVTERILWIDPVPPPSEKQIAQGLAKKDYEAFAVVGRWKEKFIVLEIRSNKGHQPDWTIKTFFELCQAWRPREVWVEAVAYQRTLKWILEQAMMARRKFYAIFADDDRRSKHDKIVDGLNGPASQGRLYIQPEMTTFKGQFTAHPQCTNDDELEAVARAVERLNHGIVLEGEAEALDEEDDQYEALGDWRICP